MLVLDQPTLASSGVCNTRRSPRTGLALGALLLMGACAQEPLLLRPSSPTKIAYIHADPGDATRHFAVATAHPLATQAAASALERGGSAADALVAASLVLSVVTPQSTGMGGGGFAVVVPTLGPAQAIDFRETAPAATRREDYLDGQGQPLAVRSQSHGLAVAVPGYVAGLLELHRRWGRLAWPELCQPAIAAADQGAQVTPQLAKAIALRWSALNPMAQQVFGRAGQPLQAGEVLRQPALADTLRQLAENPESFYRGTIAQDLASAAQAAGGRLVTADLQSYRVRVEPAMAGEVFGHQAYTMPPPSAGGAQLLAAASWLDAWLGKPPLSAPLDDHALAEAMRRSFWLRLAFSNDIPVFSLDAAYPRAARDLLATGFAPQHAVPTAALPLLQTGDAKLETHENTSHIAVIDADGLAISATHTVNLLLGAGIVAPKTGILLNNEMDDFSFAVGAQNYFGLAGSAANMVRPGARPVSSMAPLVLMQGPPQQPGLPWLAVGSPGGTRITTSVLQVVFKVLRRGATLAQAVAAPRLHHQAVPDQTEIEEAPGQLDRQKQLEMRGHTVLAKPPWCNVQAVWRQPDATAGVQWHAVSDPRGEGAAIVK